MKQRGLIMLCASAVCASSATMAQAQATDEQARKLLTALERFIDSRLLAPNPNMQLELEDRITVSAVDDHYVGAIPPGRLLMDGGENNTIALSFAEALGFDLRITEQGWYDVEFSVPSSMHIADYWGVLPADIDPSLEPDMAATATIGSRVGSALLVPEYEAVLELESIWNDWGMTFENIPVDMTFGRLSIIQTGAETDTGIYEGALTIDLANLISSDGDVETRIELDNLTLTSVWGGFDLAAYSDFYLAAEPLIVRMETEPENAGPYSQLRELLAETPSLIDSLAGDIDLKGLRVHSPDTDVDVTEISAGFSLDGLSADRANLALTFHLSDFINDPELPFQGLIPRNAGYDIRATDLPTDSLYNWLDILLASLPSSGADIAVPASLFTLYDDLAGTGAVLDIREIHVETRDASLDFSSRIRPDTAAMFGATVEADLAATAMDRLTGALNQLPAASAQAAIGLAFIQGLGEREIDAEGDTVHRYQFEVTRDGMFLLNGNDMSPLMDLMR